MSHTRKAALFTPWKLGNLPLSNRIIIPPMCMFHCEEGTGCPGAFHRMHLGSMATSGAGLVIIEATGVTPEGRISSKCPGLWSEENTAAFQALLSDIRSYSQTPIAIQLGHAGRKGSSYPTPEVHGKRQYPADSAQGWQTVAPSAIPFADTEMTPRALTVPEIKELVEAFAVAAERADKQLHLDGIELHGAHGYLLHQFLSPLSNTRTDEYGGSFDNRIRFLLEVFDAVKARVRPDLPVWVRLSSTDWMPDAPASWDLAQTVRLCQILEERGCAAVHVSSGGLHAAQKIPVSPGYQVPHALHLKRVLKKMAVIAVGLITEAVQAETILQSKVVDVDEKTGKETEKSIDAIAVARAVLFNPHWPYQAAYELQEKVVVPPSYYRSEPTPNHQTFLKTFKYQ
ncbi:NADH:flavin oxidoreductase [Angomonas deanei]|nr:NADH:flavin oxidoreductase [Angomonas deanei]|eukprot:EPY19958.1 NADH:flavin oxidoreductase [Angomonas deanei]